MSNDIVTRLEQVLADAKTEIEQLRSQLAVFENMQAFTKLWANPWVQHTNDKPIGFFSYDDDNGFSLHSTREAAMAAAESALSYYRKESQALDEWPSQVESIRWGAVYGGTEGNHIGSEEEGYDYELR